MKYAHFDSTAPQPALVLGWYHVYDVRSDPNGLKYNNLPDAADLLELTEDQWAARFETPYVSAGKLVAEPKAITLQKMKALQNDALRSGYTAAASADISFTTAGKVTKDFPASPQAVRKVNDAIVAYSSTGAVPTGFYLVATDGTQVPMTLADLQGLAKAMADQEWTASQNLQSKEAALTATKTTAAAQAITF